MFNRKFSSNIRRKKRMIISIIVLLVVFLTTGYAVFSSNLSISGTLKVDKYDQTLYGVLEKAAKKGIYAKEYTGSHQDSMGGVGTEKIYHWYAPNTTAGNALANEILDKNNVIFADHCWQMFRTTDTGGVKMIYNGEPENNQCLNTRGTHAGYTNYNSQDMQPSFYYGTSYIYDKTNNVFRLDETITTGTVKIGQYTCRSTSPTATCATLYLVDNHIVNSDYNSFAITGTSHYSQFGTTYFNENRSPAYVGYMYNNVYSLAGFSANYNITENASSSIISNYYYSSTISYNSNQYTLTNPLLISTLSDYNTLIGKYILSNGSNTSSTEARYVVAVSGNSYYYRKLVDGDLATSMMIGSSYTDNNNGTYTINSPTSVSYINWYNGDYVNHQNKYVCIGTNATCSDIKHTPNTSTVINNKSFRYCGVEYKYKYSEDVNYNSGIYTLSGDIKEIWDTFDSTEATKINTHHYTCADGGTSCSTVKYITSVSNTGYDYVILENVANITTALNEMTSVDNINQNNSIIKKGVEAWYKHYIDTSYANSNQIEDVIYCNDRTIYKIGGWSPTESVLSSNNLKFTNLEGTLNCTNITDKFSQVNNKASLAYPIGLATSPELDLLNNNILRNTGHKYWLGTPSHQVTSNTVVSCVSTTGSIGTEFLYSSSGLRPVISLLPGTEYALGTGSMADPYIILVVS